MNEDGNLRKEREQDNVRHADQEKQTENVPKNVDNEV